VEGAALLLKAPATGEVSRFAFDGVFGGAASQADVFAAVGAPLVEHVLSTGGPACCFAHGPTTAGKSHALFGEPAGEQRGLGFRAVEALFARVDAVNAAAAAGSTPHEGAEPSAAAAMTVSLSVVEAYQDGLRDLLAAAAPRPASSTPAASASAASSAASRPGSARPGSAAAPGSPREVPLSLCEDEAGRTQLKGLRSLPVGSAAAVAEQLARWRALQKKEASPMHDKAARAHTIVTLTVHQAGGGGGGGGGGRLVLVDLAGSEALPRGDSNDIRQREAKAVSHSLATLSKALLALQQGEPGVGVPYGDSKLTHVLKDCLGLGAKAALLTAAHATKLKFADTRAAVVFARCCVDPAAAAAAAATEDPKDMRIAAQAAQIASLTKQLDATHGHYQKQLEGLGGSLGPTERGGGGGGAELEAFTVKAGKAGAAGGGGSVKGRAAGRRPLSGASSKKTAAGADDGASAEQVRPPSLTGERERERERVSGAALRQMMMVSRSTAVCRVLEHPAGRVSTV
jgi:hypothetical protein